MELSGSGDEARAAVGEGGLRTAPDPEPGDLPRAAEGGAAAGRGDHGEGRHRRLLVCFSQLRWDFVWQRPQHLMTRAAVSHRVVVFEEPVFAGAEAPRLCVTDRPGGIEVAVPRLPEDCPPERAIALQRALLDTFLAGAPEEDRTFWYYTPAAAAFSGHGRRDLTVYDNMDELSAFHGAPRDLALREADLLRRADLVFTGGRSLHEAKRLRRPDAHLFPSSVDAAHFGAARGRKAALAPSPRARPTLGFFGVIDERLDLDLLAAAADLRPGWRFAVVGPIVKIEPGSLPRRPNLEWAGPCAYADLPAVIAGWDVGMMPFALNAATRFISPTKTPEYLAAGVPVVSTAVADVVRDYGDEGLVAIAAGAAELVAAAESLMARPREAWLAAVDRRLAAGSWDATWACMARLMAAARAGRRRAEAPAGAAPRRRWGGGYDWLVVGAGFAGSVLAERLASERGETVLVVDRRPHLGGNAHDHLNEAGLLVHRYGPHIFHTNAGRVVDYLSRFTSWRPYQHRVLARVDGRLLPVPINLDTINGLYGLDLDPAGMEAFLAARAEPVGEVRTAEDVVVSTVGRDLYETFFRGYTRKQWGLDPSELDRSVTARVPTRCSRDDRYFTDSFQAMPAEGYTRLFERMLDHPNITVALGVDFADVRRRVPHGRTVFTGPIDEYFDLRFGPLPYRSLRFDHRTLDEERHQPVAVVNYPGAEDYTRVTEYKHLTGQAHPKTAVTYEYPSAEGDPYYPIPRPESQALFKRYEALARTTEDVWFVGRLATYRYHNMDQIVAQALTTFARIDAALPRLATARTTTGRRAPDAALKVVGGA